MNYVNYLKHTIRTPSTAHRRYDLDLEGMQGESKAIAQAKRIALVALPFLGLYRPISAAVSIGMGTCRIVSHLHLSLAFEEKRHWGHFSKELAETALATFSVVSMILSFPIGLVVI